MIKLLCSNLDVLRQVYETFADFVEGVQVLKLATSANQQGGLYRLLELYDVTPTYLSKVEAKVLFTLTLHAQVTLFPPFDRLLRNTSLCPAVSKALRSRHPISHFVSSCFVRSLHSATFGPRRP